MIFMLDNYDSFTYNLVRYCRELGFSVMTRRNDDITCEEIADLNPSHIIISPGPGRPENAGISLDVIRYFAKRIPILGVCLGHQAIATHFGGKIINAEKVMHGKISKIRHHQRGLFNNIDNEFNATRYHSLVIDPNQLPDELEVTAWAERDGVQDIMAIAHKTLSLYGVQFHPESVLTEHGHQLLKNFCDR